MLDSGFCVLKGIVELRKKGIFAGALIKTHQFWPALVPGKAIDLHFEGKAIRECDTILGKFNEVKYLFGE